MAFTMQAVGVLGLVAMALAALSVSCPCGAAVLVKDTRPSATIVIGADPSAQAREVAEDLQAILERMSGAKLPIAAAAHGAPGLRILVGQSAARDDARRVGLTIPSGVTSQFDDEGYVVAVEGETIILAGNETPPYQGTAYAVYDFLHELGCRWYFPGEFGEVLPRLSTVEVAPCGRAVRPEFRIRNIRYSGWMGNSERDRTAYELWKRRNRMSSPETVEATFLPLPSDDTSKYLLPKEKYLEKHPEYFALKADGSRNPDFLCMSNPGALLAATDTIAEYFGNHPEYHCFSFSPPDEPVLCHCPDCQKTIHGGFGGEGWGEVSDAYFGFVFRLADQVAQRCPGKWIASMAYYNRCRPPIDVTRRRPNLLIYLASIQQCVLHSSADADHCWNRRAFAGMLRQWADLSAGLVYYEYDPHDWGMLQRPTWRSAAIADDFRLLKENGGWGFNDEGQTAWLSTGLNYYVRARLAWDVRQDPQKLVQDFCDRFFGPASKPMLRYYTAMEQAQRPAGMHRQGSDSFGDWHGPATDFLAVWTRPVLDRCLGWLGEAGRLASVEPYRTRVAAFRAHCDRLDAFSHAHAALAQGDYGAAAKWGAEMVKAVERVGDPALLADYGPITKGNGSGAAVSAFAQWLSHYADGRKGRAVAVFPVRAEFRADPISEGIVMGWFRPGFSAEGWRPIRVDAGWHNQGVTTPEGKPYSGVAWYRIRVAIPEVQATEPLHLLIPAVRARSVTVWCNGVFAGHLQDRRPDNLMVDVGGLVRPGENLFAFRVAGEELGGGLLLPPLLCVPLDPRGEP
jgi:hypothetical protein